MTHSPDPSTAERCEALLLRLRRASGEALDAVRADDVQTFRARMRARDALIATLSPLLDEHRAAARSGPSGRSASVKRIGGLLSELQHHEAELRGAVEASRTTAEEELGTLRRRAAALTRYATASAPRSRIDLTR